jgi:transposase
MSKKNK